MQIFMRVNEGCGSQPLLLWDSAWVPAEGEADWALAGADETQNRGGLAARAPLETVVILCLFTDKRAPPELEAGGSGPGGVPPRLDDGDPRGWWGDGIDVREDDGEAALGSWLWLLERSALTDETARLAAYYAQEALAVLVTQEACVRVETSASFDELTGRLDLTAALYGQDGTRIYDGRFEIYWRDLR